MTDFGFSAWPNMKLRSLSLATKTVAIVVAAMGLLTLVVMTVAAVLLSHDINARATERGGANLRVAWDVLADYGTDFSARDGRLYVGSTPLNGFDEPVDRIKTLVGGTATLFLNDQEVATNLLSDTGLRTAGAAWRPGIVQDTVLREGRPYRGQADILGRTYFVAYDPIKTVSGETIGAVRVAIPKADFTTGPTRVLIALFLCSLALTALAIPVCLYLSRRIFSPLTSLAERLEALRQGRTAFDAPWTDRQDDIGVMSRAILAFRDAEARQSEIERETESLQQAAQAMRIATDADHDRRAEEDAAAILVLGEALAALSRGDLTHRIEADFAERSRSLKDDYNTAVEALAGVIDEAADLAHTVRAGSSDLIDSLRRSDHETAHLQDAAPDVRQLSEATTRAATDAHAALAATTTGRASGEASRLFIDQTVGVIAEIGTSASRIGEIISIIEDIAFQTNLLALNAEVAAAHSDQTEYVPALAALEISALAQRCTEAALQIRDLNADAIEGCGSGVRLLADLGASLTAQIEQMTALHDLTTRIAQSTKHQAGHLAKVDDAVNLMDDAARQNAVQTEQAVVARQSLDRDAERLAELISHFRIAVQTAPAPEAIAA